MRLVLVVDLGSGTFDATLLRAGRNVSEEGFEELGRDGDENLGGRNWDLELADWVARKNLSDDREVTLWLRGEDDYRIRHNYLFEECEKAKTVFFNRPRTERGLSLLVPFFSPKKGARRLDTRVSAQSFLDRTAPLVEQCVFVCERLFADVSRATGHRIDWKDLDCIYMAGGGSKMWTVQEAFADRWGREPVLDKEPQHAVAKGAALVAQALHAGRLPSLIGRRRYPHSIGIRTRSEDGTYVFDELVPRNQKIAFSLESVFPPVSRRANASRLKIVILERKLSREGPKDTPIKTLDLEVPPRAMAGRDEQIVVRVACDNESQLDCHIEFRRKKEGGTITDELKWVAGDNGVSRNGTAGPSSGTAPFTKGH